MLSEDSMIIVKSPIRQTQTVTPDRDWTRFGDRYCMFLAAESFDFVGDSRGNLFVVLRDLLCPDAQRR